MTRVVYMDGTFVSEADATLSIYDLSVMQAAAAFEMTRSFNGQPFKLREHVQRLAHSCHALSIPFPWTVETLEGLCHDLADRNDHGPGEEHRLLLVVSPGCAPMYRALDGVIAHPYLYLADFPLRYTVQGFGRYFTQGVHAVTSPIRQVPDASVPSMAKHRSRLHFHLAQQQAPPGTWPLLRNEAGAYCEAPGANLVAVRRGEVRGVTANALGGISMATAVELAGGRFVAEGVARVAELDELWLTGTPFCLLPVVALDGTPIGEGTPGPVYRRTLAAWNARVGLDIAEQIRRWDSQA